MIYINTFYYETDKEKYRTNIEDLFRNTVMNDGFDNRDIELIWIIDKAQYGENNTIINFMKSVT